VYGAKGRVGVVAAFSLSLLITIQDSRLANGDVLSPAKSLLDVCVQGCERVITCSSGNARVSEANHQGCVEGCEAHLVKDCFNEASIIQVWNRCSKQCSELSKCNPPACEPAQVASSLASAPLNQRLTSGDALITAHFPADFAAEDDAGPQGIILMHDIDRDHTESVTLVAVKGRPRDLTELVGAVRGKPYFQGRRTRSARCNGQPGVEFYGTDPKNSPYPAFRSDCAFVRNGHGYVFGYSITLPVVERELRRLQSIIEATEFKE
jgi:hypothetical protein